MKFALILTLSLLAVASASPALFSNKNNQINTPQQQQQQTYMSGDSDAKTPTIELLKQWCFSSQMSQQELTASFKKLVGVVQSSPLDQTTEAAVMSEHICQGALVQKSQSTGQTVGQTGADAKAHELIKDVYMDALISCKSRDCTKQLLKVISSQQVDTIRASYYMTRIAVADNQSIKDPEEIKQFAESFIQGQQQHESEAVERQKLFATTSIIGKWMQDKPSDSQIKQVAEQVAKSITERYIKPVSQQEVEQYKQQSQQQQQQQSEIAKKIAKRSAALKALANIPGHVIKQCPEVEQVLVQICQNKQELVTVRQSAIECLEQNDKQMEVLKQIAFEQQEPIEVRIAAYRALMTVTYQGETQTKQQEQTAQQIVQEIVKHCEDESNQQQDEQFCLYAISHLDNIRTSQQPEHQAIKESIAKNKQHYMQIQVLSKKFRKQLADVRRSSRNYKLEQEFNQLESGLVLEGDIIYESNEHKQQQQVLPKLVRVNMSMPIMGETVNVIEVTLRQNQMDEEILSVLKLAQQGSAKFTGETVSKVVDSFKSSVGKQQQQQEEGPIEADLTIKVDGCTVVYVCVDDVKAAAKKHAYATATNQHQRNTRSAYHTQGSIIEQAIEYLKRQPVNFNRGFNVNINERIAKLVDVDANILAGLRFESSAQGSLRQGDFEIAAHMEPRFSFEAVVGPAKVSSKKLLQRVSTKSALGLRLRFKRDELVDFELELPMNTMELFTIETQLVERSASSKPHSYNYLPESIYGAEDIYSAYKSYGAYGTDNKMLFKRSIADYAGFSNYKNNKNKNSIKAFFGKSMSIAHVYETPESVGRATGLRGKLSVAASPKDTSLVVSCILQKTEPQMAGYRVRVQKVGRSGELEQYLWSVSTPNSSVERNVEVRVTKQMSKSRTMVKAEVQTPQGAYYASGELVQDARQSSVRAELGAGKQWRHQLEAGLITGPQSAGGRLAQFAYKPYLSIDSSSLARPIQLAGSVALQQSPKSVISYELKSSSPMAGSGLIQGKLIVEQREVGASYSMRQRSSSPYKRSMQSPIEVALTRDLTLSHEMMGQVGEHQLKVQHMLDWDCKRFALSAQTSAVYKNARRPAKDARLAAQLKLDQEQQVMSVERKTAGSEHSVRVVSQVSPSGHQMDVECRHNGRQQSVTGYKHKVVVVRQGPSGYDVSADFELVDSGRQINERLVARARLQGAGQAKRCQLELSNGPRKAKLAIDFQSLEQHQIQVSAECQTYQHKSELRNNKRQFVVQARTDNKRQGQTLGKLMVEVNKVEAECKLAYECPAKRQSLAADIKLGSGKRSSYAVQTARFAAQGDFSFETVKAPLGGLAAYLPFQKSANLRFRSNVKDLAAKQAYWMDSAFVGSDMFDSEGQEQEQEQSYLRFDSPYYRADLEFEPRHQEAKFGSFMRSKRSADNYVSVYSNKDSSLADIYGANQAQAMPSLSLGANKLWMVRSVVSSPFARDQLKQKARRALFEYADRRQNQRHSIEYSPSEERLDVDLWRQPNTEFVSSDVFGPMRAKAALSARLGRPSSVSLDSDLMRLEAEATPFGQEESYAKLSAVSRHPRAAFKKHESEFRYSPDQGYKAWMKHQDKQGKHHEGRLEAGREPSKYAKLDFESEKHGKANWEHKWRSQQKKRAADQEQVYANKVAFARTSGLAAGDKYAHKTSFEWEEPSGLAMRQQQRTRRSYYLAETDSASASAPTSILGSIYGGLAKTQNYRYSPIDYLKHASARLSSESSGPGEQLYKLDFDYAPQQNYASLNLATPAQMIHAAQVEAKPSESLYKIQARHFNRLTNEPSYEFTAATKPYGLASAEQEPVFVESEHEMFAAPVSKASLAYQLLKQPMKLDYSDKLGRKFGLDYDQSPVAAAAAAAKYAGLRMKRAALYYKDQAGDFEHESTYDFYPETWMAKMRPGQYGAGKQGDVAFKAETKYGPVVVRADASGPACLVSVESPVVSAKLVGEAGANSRKLYKLTIDNKSQRVQFGKLLRNFPETIRDCRQVKRAARALDSGRFEHKAELVASLVEQIFKVKSATTFNERPVVVIEGEYNREQGKAYAKVDGERVKGQALVDLMRKSAELVADVDGAQGVQHVTRIERTPDNYYSISSTTSRMSRPVFQLSGKISPMILEPEHLFASRRGQAEPSHVSSFEAVLYEPKELRMSATYDCQQREARVVFRDEQEQRFSETLIRYHDQTDSLHFESRLTSKAEGQIYAAKAKVSVQGLMQSGECAAYNKRHNNYDDYKYYSKSQNKYGAMSTFGSTGCQSEAIYSDKSGDWSAKYQPGEYVTVSGPRGKQTINLAAAQYYY